jgi:hypothetical protein
MQAGTGSRLSPGGTVTVRTITLETLFREQAIDRVGLLKLDVEGAEYAILEKMLRDRTLRRINHLFIEWHWAKIAVPESTHRALVDRLTKHVPILEWDAQGY